MSAEYPVSFDEVNRSRERWPSLTFYQVQERLSAEKAAKAAATEAKAKPIGLCPRCHAPGPSRSTVDAYCDPCSSAMKEEARLAWENRPLDPWPLCWPLRPILDLHHFEGEPLSKAIAIEQVLAGGGLVGLIGDRGRGKTVMAAWLANERRKKRKHPGIYLRAADAFELIRETWDSKRPSSQHQLTDTLRGAGFLVLDEIQERAASDWENSIITNILDHRHAELLPTLIIGNLTQADLGANLGPSVVDRMKQSGGIVNCDWPNLRKPGAPPYTAEERASVPRSSHMFKTSSSTW